MQKQVGLEYIGMLPQIFGYIFYNSGKLFFRLVYRLLKAPGFFFYIFLIDIIAFNNVNALPVHKIGLADADSL